MSSDADRRGRKIPARVGDERFLVKGVTYGTFAPDAQGYQFPPPSAGRRRLPPDGGPRHQHGPHLHAAAPRPARRSGPPRPARHGRAAVVAARRVSRRSLAEARRSGASSSRKVARARRSSCRARCSRSATRSRRASSAGTAALRVERFLREPVRGREGGVARQPVHLRQLSADRVPRPLVLRHLRVQRLPAPRAGAARLPRAAAAHRRPEAAAARRSGRRQHPRRRRPARPTITAMHIRAAFEEGACGAIAFAWTDEWWRGGHRGRRLGVRPRRSRAPPEAGGGAPSPAAFARRAVLARAQRDLAARVGRRLRLQRRRHARGLPRVARAADLSGLRNHPRQRRLARSHRARSAARIRACASSTSRTAA